MGGSYGAAAAAAEEARLRAAVCAAERVGRREVELSLRELATAAEDPALLVPAPAWGSGGELRGVCAVCG
eukprot:gene6572-6415_t